MNKKIIVVFVLIAVVSASLTAIAMFQLQAPNSNPKIALSVDKDGQQWEGESLLQLELRISNPTNYTLFNCVVNVNYLAANGSYLIATSDLGIINPFQTENTYLTLENVYYYISDSKEGINCTAYGYSKP